MYKVGRMNSQPESSELAGVRRARSLTRILKRLSPTGVNALSHLATHRTTPPWTGNVPPRQLHLVLSSRPVTMPLHPLSCSLPHISSSLSNCSIVRTQKVYTVFVKMPRLVDAREHPCGRHPSPGQGHPEQL
ncbi:hypothetical protein ElyMa_000261400 [Elysia marginata]|uniref:Uncharacterized protein n=1 Tax=Elysia marginata TaxID=1093978 RepID=A0AAV4F652_9GAST|nr:hypothetical protein ElyMa_000261400 [Elysia marginata]